MVSMVHYGIFVMVYLFQNTMVFAMEYVDIFSYGYIKLTASFHSKGTTPSFNDTLNTLASGVLICSTVSISSFGLIPSTPDDLLSFIVFIFLATISGVTINFPKQSDLAS